MISAANPKYIGNKCIGLIYCKAKYTGMIWYFRNVCFKDVYFENKYSEFASSLKLLGL
jgi:hypothetical protein